MPKTNPSISFRHATIDDLALLKHWDEQPHVKASDPDDWGWGEDLLKFPHWREQLIAELNGRPLGFVQIIDPAEEESHYWGEVPKDLRAIDIWIGEKEDLGKGYGTIMMNMAIARCFANKRVTAILIDPLETNTKAIRFYERIGFQFVETKVFGRDICSVMRFDRKDWTEL